MSRSTRHTNPVKEEVATLRGDTQSSTSKQQGMSWSGSIFFDEFVADASDAQRMLLQLCVQKSVSAEQALDDVVLILVDGSSEKVTAIANAIRSNEKLYSQWNRAWHQLKEFN